MKKDDTLLVGAIKELEKAYDRLMPLFNLDMPKPIITIQSKGGQGMKAWFSACRWKVEDKKEIHEINICAEYLAESVLEIANSLTHEMTHYGNHVRGLKDCSSNQYHNGNFKALAEKVGLVCTKGKKGYAETNLGPTLKEYVESKVLIDPDCFLMFRQGNPPRKVSVPKRLTWSCGCTSVMVAAKTELKATCDACGKGFECREVE